MHDDGDADYLDIRLFNDPDDVNGNGAAGNVDSDAKLVAVPATGPPPVGPLPVVIKPCPARPTAC
jgi:hypothetical protein